MKKLVIAALGASLLFGVALAADRSTQTLPGFKAKADREIERRLGTLNKLTDKIGDAKHLSDADSTALANQVKTEITDLTALKAKIDGDSDAVTLRTDVKSIVTEYRVYRLIVPKIALIRAADAELAAAANLSDLAVKLQDKLDKAKAAGNDITVLQSELTDLKTKLTAAEAQAQAVQASVIGLTPADFDANPQILTGKRDQLKAARDSLLAARSLAKDIEKALASFKQAAPQPTTKP